jgi:hypothetical protein
MKYVTIATLTLLLIFNQTVSACERGPALIGSLDSDVIDEASGVVPSKMREKKLIWINDSGGRSELIGTSLTGEIEKRVHLKEFYNRDYEALANGPCPSDKTANCIYVGDIGEGFIFRWEFKVGIFKEADFWASSSIRPEKIIHFSYPDKAVDAEAMIVDSNGNINLFSKSGSGISEVFYLSLSGKIHRLGEINLNGKVAGTKGKGPKITDAALSFDEKKVLLLTYGDIVEFNKILIDQLPTRAPWIPGRDFSILKGPELPQQETLTYIDPAGSFIVSSEYTRKNEPQIYLYKCAQRIVN